MEAPAPEKLRLRIAAWARYVYVKMRVSSVNEMAKHMRYGQPSLNKVIAGDANPGIDFAVKLAAFGQESLDRICFLDPPEQFFSPGIPRLDTPLTDRPRRASVEPPTRKHKADGGE